MAFPKKLPCPDNCGISLNWHVNSGYADGWSARVTVFNWGANAVGTGLLLWIWIKLVQGMRMFTPLMGQEFHLITRLFSSKDFVVSS